MGSSRVWSREEIAHRILQGDILVVYDGRLLRIPQKWLDSHPGGALSILHFVGRDASDEILAYHAHHILKQFAPYVVGSVEKSPHGWQPFVPPVMTGWVRKIAPDGHLKWHNEAAVLPNKSISSEILLLPKDSSILSAHPARPSPDTLIPPPTALDLKTQAEHSAAYKQLHTRVVEAGLFQCRYITGYGPEVARYILLGGGSAFAYKHNWLMTSAVCLGLLWHQLVFTVHDLGHMGVTHNWAIDRFIGIVLADWIGGLSVGWWVDNHNVHHLVTNHPSHDPDIEHLPFLAISTAFFNSLWSSYYKRVMAFDRFAKFLVSLQHRLFYIVLSFGRFNLYVLSYGHLLRQAFDKPRARGGRWAWWMEVLGIVFFWCWFGPVLKGCGSWPKALAYLLVSHWVTSPLHVQIVLSHFSMSTDDLGPTESFPARQLRTTTDVVCPDALSFVHGGLHLQVTHHLFPRLPRHNLRAASVLVKEFARERGLTYAEFGFVRGNAEVLDVLKGVADQAKIMTMVVESEVKEAMGKKD
ncbi:delta 8-sphingoloid desaturase protein [Coniophora puteana RWD-64-598 SS2]|uniref:Delta 8-(E)-sphingolipid desaturase n=1 Tax=Coniophora puteana (strain RWD-64-598) TaxID=741705 RepID=A0A5M3N6U8_CONPW|nr:delta 8-sphingoloid desaturase protein [Coniophora puteana RWD-64-598 SS2]EIW86784.1 delta 8-sphingoloid desaturase protein [Coniophora puteana RWD-64-598 SS2]